MNARHLALLMAAAGTIALVHSADNPKRPNYNPPRVIFNNVHLKSDEVYVYEQKPVAVARPVLVAPGEVNALIERFKTNYAKLGSPRLVFYVNREMGVVLQTAETGATSTNSAMDEAAIKIPDLSPETLADRQTIRDLERLFGRPFRTGGATLADQRIATETVSLSTLRDLRNEGERARKDREALGKIADVAVEILISSRQVIVPQVSGDVTYSVPDIQATAIRVSDASIVGQATSADILGNDSSAARIVRHFSVPEIVEATALALMQDMLLEVRD